MEKTRILVFIRVSTEAQEYDEQKKQMVEYCKTLGYSEDKIIYVEDKGASAIKQNEKYVQMLDEVKAHVEKKDISAVAVWAVNRLARNEETFFKMKQLFIDNQIQFYVKNPSLSLFNEDGTVNTGSELALSLFATMSKQDMLEKQEKFKRTKHAYATMGKYTGGHTVKYGYKVDDNGYFVVDEEEAKIIRLAYELYSTGEHSCFTIMKEFADRGIMERASESFLIKILSFKGYYGEVDTENHNRIYPPIITKELYDKVAKVREENRLSFRDNERVILGSKLVRCPECGCAMTSTSRYYYCCKHRRDVNIYCPYPYTLNENVAHAILWKVASACHLDYLTYMNEDKIKEYKAKMELLKQKIAVLDGKIAKFVEKKNRIVDSYLEGLIDKKTRDAKIAKWDVENKQMKMDRLALQENIDSIQLLLNSDVDVEESFINALDVYDASAKNIQERYDITHKYIKKLVHKRVKYGVPDKRAKHPNAIEITVTTIHGKEWKYLYFPRGYKNHILLAWNGKKWLEEDALISGHITPWKSGEEKLMEAIKNFK